MKMLSKSFSIMENKIWKQCPTTTNAVERRNKDCKCDVPQSLKLAMIKVYKVDKVALLKTYFSRRRCRFVIQIKNRNRMKNVS